MNQPNFKGRMLVWLVGVPAAALLLFNAFVTSDAQLFPVEESAAIVTSAPTY